MKKIAVTLFQLFVFLGLAKILFAYDLTLTKIGTLSTIGADYSLVSYTGSVPGLEGTATPAATVSIKVNSSTSNVIAATASGVWTYTPTSLSIGDNAIVITSGTQSISFTIRYNTSVTPTPTSTMSGVTELPDSGVWENIAIGVFGGLGVMYFGWWLKRKMHTWEKGH